jgi:hypothetical protein
MTEKELIKFGFKRIYVDEDANEIDEKLVNPDNIYYWYTLQIHIANDIVMYFESCPNQDVIDDDWHVDFNWDEFYWNGFKIKSIDAIKSIIDLFLSIKLK